MNTWIPVVSTRAVRLETAARQVFALRKANLKDVENAQRRPLHAKRLSTAIEGRTRAINRLIKRHGADRIDNECFRIFGQDRPDGDDTIGESP